MLFTLENVYENRELFQNSFSRIIIDYTTISKLCNAKTKDEFMQVIYDNFKTINDQINYFIPNYKHTTDFIGNLAVVFDSYGNYNIVGKDGFLLFKQKIKNYYELNNNYIAIFIDNKWGILNLDGSWLFTPQFDDIIRNDVNVGADDIVNVKISDKWGYVKTDGSWLIKPKYEESSDFRNGYTKVLSNDSLWSPYCLIDILGNEFENDGSWDDPDGADYEDED